jgi:hypothetical protein
MKYLFFVFLIIIGLGIAFGYLVYDHVPTLPPAAQPAPGGSGQVQAARYDLPATVSLGTGGGGVVTAEEFAALESTVRDLREQLTQAQEEMVAAKNKADSLQKQLKVAQAGKKAAEVQLSDLQQQLGQAQADLKAANDQAGDLQRQLEQARADLKTAVDRANDLQQQLEQARNDLNIIQGQILKDRSAIELLGQQNERLQAEANTAWAVAYAGLGLGGVAAIVIASMLVLVLRWRKQPAASTTRSEPDDWRRRAGRF